MRDWSKFDPSQEALARLSEDDTEDYLRWVYSTTEDQSDERPVFHRAEAACWDLLKERGNWWVHRKGWPDFLCTGSTTDNRQITFAVEVKRHPEDFPREHQIDTMKALEAAGIPCFVWDRYTGFRRVGTGYPDIGEQPGDAPCPDPGLLRCGFCRGGGVEHRVPQSAFSWKPGDPPVQATYEKCHRCGGSGLAVPRLTEVK